MTRSSKVRRRVLIADDHKVVAEGIARSLSEYFDVVGQLHQLGLLVQTIQECRPDVVVLDLTFDGVSSLPIMKQVLDQSEGDIHFVILTAHESDALRQAALDAGATTFLLKGVGTDVLRVSIDAAAEGRAFAPKLQQQQWGRGNRKLLTVDGIHLRENQIRVLLLFHEGLNRTQAAERLNLTVRGVDFHLRVVRDTLGIRTLALLLNWVGEQREALEAALEGLEVGAVV